MDGWVFWIIAAIVLAVGEMLTLSFFLAPFAGGALLAAIVDAAGGGVVLSWGIFIVASLILLLVVRPIARSHRKMPAQLRTGTAALIGRRGVVVERVNNHEAVGAIRIDNGEVWTARAFDDDESYDVGARVEVVEIRGATALVTE
ncbi:MAG: NfeD family protein [Actinomycetota bacterium]|nr:NfeD family protein [Actinomycetota bacterium]